MSSRDELTPLSLDPSEVEAVPETGGMTVLIADDNEQIARLLRLMFEVESFTVIGSASDGAEACELALQHKPDFAILDYMMPGVNGEQAAACIRALTPNTRIVAFSAVLDHKPDWADAFVNKDCVSDLVPLLMDGNIKSRGVILSANLPYLHALPGRLRLKIMEAKGEAGIAKQIHELLSAMEGVHSVKLNARTGNALIGFDPQKLVVNDFVRILRAAGYLAERVPGTDHDNGAGATPEASSEAVPANGRRGDLGASLIETVVVTTVELVLKAVLKV